jgi:hypothetical protein
MIQKKAKKIRKMGYKGTIIECQCGFVGKLSEAKIRIESKGVCICPICDRKINAAISL